MYVLKKAVLAMVGVIIVGVAMYAVADSTLSLPVVYTSHESDECVYVLTEKGVSDCSEMPKKYYSEHAKPGMTYERAKEQYSRK